MKHDLYAFKILCGFVIAIAMMPAAAGADPGAGYARVTGPCELTFPDAHGPHPDYRTEWWYYTGHLKTSDKRRFGYQLTFFRTRLRPPDSDRQWPQPASNWRTAQIYLAHAAVSDLEQNRFIFRERASRPVLGMAGAKRQRDKTRVFIGDWSTRIGPAAHRLSVQTPVFAFDLMLHPSKPPVAHGDGGYSRKGTAVHRASCYYSLTRLATKGTLTIDGQRLAVDGSSWMDHEFATAPLDPELTGWDWFGLQLDDQTEIMIYLLRDKDGRLHPASSGTYVAANGQTVHLGRKDFSVAVRGHWTSRESGARYPASWRISVGEQRLELEITPDLSDQEVRAQSHTGVTYWEGSVSVSGRSGQQAVAGKGYVELTGYASAFDAPL